MRSSPGMRPPRWSAPWLAAAVAIVLTLPCFHFRWLWDDFDFVARAETFRLSHLLPDSATVYYRPLSRELYFGLIWLAGRGSPLVGHILNAALLALATLLVVSLGTRLSGRRAGVLSGLAFATLGAASFLVAWVSGAQDLLAIVFVLLALRLQVDGRSVPAAAALVCAALSKETALTALPVLAALPWILGARPRRPVAHALPYIIGLIVWLAVHPGIRILASREFTVGTEGYVGLGNPNRLEFAGRMLLALVNLPASGIGTPWPSGRGAAAAAACVLVALTTLGLGARRPHEERREVPPILPRRVVLLGALIAIGPLALASVLIKYWSAYYSVFPAIGTSLIAGMGLARIPRPAALGALLVFTVCGVWSRWATHDPDAPCERYFESCSRALERVEAGFKSLNPTLPRGATALVSVASTGALGVYLHMHRFQALKAWYRDPSIITLEPEARQGGGGPEFLFRLTPDLDVVEIDTERAAYRSTGARPDPLEVSRPARTYARALARAGETDRAVRIEHELAARDRGALRLYDERLAAMYLLMAGRTREADSILAITPAYSREVTLDVITKILMEASSPDGPERHAFRAFGIDPSDVDANRYMMRRLRREGLLRPASFVAQDFLAIVPGDSESLAIIAEAARSAAPDRLTSQVTPELP